MTDTSIEALREAAIALYKPPFRFDSGYIFDAENQMVADQHETSICRVRGWGRIGYMGNAEALQNKVGELIAEALTNLWNAAPAVSQQEPIGYITEDDLADLKKSGVSTIYEKKQKRTFGCQWTHYGLYLAPLQAAQPGYVMVPVELTDEMIEAGMEADCAGRPSVDDDRHVRSIWTAMIKAAPGQVDGGKG